jgi:hypothetical protein
MHPISIASNLSPKWNPVSSNLIFTDINTKAPDKNPADDGENLEANEIAGLKATNGKFLYTFSFCTKMKAGVRIISTQTTRSSYSFNYPVSLVSLAVSTLILIPYYNIRSFVNGPTFESSIIRCSTIVSLSIQLFPKIYSICSILLPGPSPPSSPSLEEHQRDRRLQQTTIPKTL